MRWFYSTHYDYGAGIPGDSHEVHGFVLDKPSLIRRALCEDSVASERDFEEPDPIGLEDFTDLHSRRVLDGLRDPTAVATAIELSEIAALPAAMVWQAVVSPQLHAAGGTAEALVAAAAGDWAANLSGGFHHAGPDLSHGFCLVNDVALAVHRLRSRGERPRILIVDLDLHQGDGNAVFFQGDAEVFTLSVHEEALFPIPKARSDLDVGLPGATGDDEYLSAVDRALEQAEGRFTPEIVVYVAGSDPFADDPMGTLTLSAAGLAERDRRVAVFTARRDAALVALPAGGYSTASPTLTAAGFAEISRHA